MSHIKYANLKIIRCHANAWLFLYLASFFMFYSSKVLGVEWVACHDSWLSYNISTAFIHLFIFSLDFLSKLSMDFQSYIQILRKIGPHWFIILTEVRNELSSTRKMAHATWWVMCVCRWNACGDVYRPVVINTHTHDQMAILSFQWMRLLCLKQSWIRKKIDNINMYFINFSIWSRP